MVHVRYRAVLNDKNTLSGACFLSVCILEVDFIVRRDLLLASGAAQLLSKEPCFIFGLLEMLFLCAYFVQENRRFVYEPMQRSW